MLRAIKFAPHRRSAVICGAGVVVGLVLLAASVPRPAGEATRASRSRPAGEPTRAARSSHDTGSVTSVLSGIHKIKHVIMIMQENRSFDSYFGTFPGANGIPRRKGAPTVCVPDPARHTCVRPFLDNRDVNYGGPHNKASAIADINGGRMDGFISNAELIDSISNARDVMGHRDWRSIPNYWTYARRFVLQDRMFASNLSWSLPEHLFMVSGWSAACSNRLLPRTCVNNLWQPPGSRDRYGWTDLTYLLHKHHVSWRYYVRPGFEPDCANASESTCSQSPQDAVRAGQWNPLPAFTTVRQDGQLRDVTLVGSFFRAARVGRLPAVAWIVPSASVGEHPPMSVSAGQAYVTRLINAVMRGPQWRSSAIFLSWDEWGGMYDHVPPPRADRNGYGLRVPGLVISPYARRGYIDHQTLSHDAYVKFIEDDFLNGQRIDPRTDGRPDPRPEVRESDPLLGDLRRDFNFAQRPRRPLILPPYPH